MYSTNVAIFKEQNLEIICLLKVKRGLCFHFCDCWSEKTGNKPKRNETVNNRFSKVLLRPLNVCVHSDVKRMRVHGSLSVTWLYESEYEHRYQFTCRFLFFFLPLAVSNSHVCLLGVDVAHNSAYQEWAKLSRAESGTVLFHHHPHWGNVKPWVHCQSS